MDHARGYDAGYEAGGHDMIRTMWDGPCIKQNAFGAEPCLESDPDPCIVCRLGADRDTLTAKLQASARALELPLMFHSGGIWTPEKSARWKEITGTEEATTKRMCDTIRAVLASPEARATGERND